MPSLTIPPPPPPQQQQQTKSTQSNPPTRLPPIIPPEVPSNNTYPNGNPSSPVAPEFSPITPKAHPALPATYPPPDLPPGGDTDGAPAQSSNTVEPESSAQYIPQPPPQPFSSEDAPDAIALRAAISSLQFQKKKAQEDIRELERIRKKALEEPALFRSELAAGKLSEQRPKVGDLRAILDEGESGDEEDEEDEVVLGAVDKREVEEGQGKDAMEVDVAESQQRSSPSTSSSRASPTKDGSRPFGRIPGPQNVVRMPYVNWEKYHVTGEPLDALHEQQRKWPGSFGYGEKGREHAIAAPYSPWLDTVHSQQGTDGARRNDSVTTPGMVQTPVSATGTMSEHPMETRRKQTYQ